MLILGSHTLKHSLASLLLQTACCFKRCAVHSHAGVGTSLSGLVVGHELGALLEGHGLLILDTAQTCLTLLAASCECDGKDVVGLGTSVRSRVAWNWLEVAHASWLVLNSVEDVSGSFHGLAAGAAVGHGRCVGEEGSLVLFPMLLLDEVVSLGGVDTEEGVA